MNAEESQVIIPDFDFQETSDTPANTLARYSGKYTEEEEVKLLELVRDGLSAEEISRIMERPASGIALKVGRLMMGINGGKVNRPRVYGILHIGG